MDSLINLLLFCAIVLLVVVVLHLLYICRMRRVYKQQLHREKRPRKLSVHPLAGMDPFPAGIDQPSSVADEPMALDEPVGDSDVVTAASFSRDGIDQQSATASSMPPSPPSPSPPCSPPAGFHGPIGNESSSVGAPSGAVTSTRAAEPLINLQTFSLEALESEALTPSAEQLAVLASLSLSPPCSPPPAVLGSIGIESSEVATRAAEPLVDLRTIILEDGDATQPLTSSRIVPMSSSGSGDASGGFGESWRVLEHEGEMFDAELFEVDRAESLPMTTRSPATLLRTLSLPRNFSYSSDSLALTDRVVDVNQPPALAAPAEVQPPIPYATALIWPNVEVFVLVLFAPLLAGKSVDALAHAYVSACCTMMSCWLPVVVLICIAYALLRTSHVIWRFSGTVAGQLFDESLPPKSASQTPDPIFRALNRVRAAFGLALIDRFTGRYRVAPVNEPAIASSVRILSRPFGYWGHDFHMEPTAGAHALYTLWIGDGRGPRPGYILTTLVLNILLQMVLSISALEAAFAYTWLVQGLLVVFLLALGALSMLCLAPTCDRLLSLQASLIYVLNALSAIYAFSAYHVETVDETSALATSDALTQASIWTMVVFALYDAFAIAFINRIHLEGFTCTALCRATISVPLDAVRLLNVLFTIILGLHHDIVRIPPNPYASNAMPSMTSSHEPRLALKAGGAFPTDGNDVTDVTDELTTSEMSAASTYRGRVTDCLRATLTVLLGGPMWDGAPRSEPSPDSKLKTIEKRNSSFHKIASTSSFTGRVVRMPNQLGTITIRKAPARRSSDLRDVPNGKAPLSWTQPYE